MVSAESDPRRAGTIWVLNLDQPAPVVKPQLDASFCRVSTESISELAVAMGSDSSTEILKRLESGRRCYAAQLDGNPARNIGETICQANRRNARGKFAAYGWVSFNEEFIGELNLRLRLLRGEAYIWDCATLPEFRHKHLYSALLAYMVGELRAEKFRRVWIGADLENSISQRGIARAGFVHVADLIVARVVALRQVWVQGFPEIPDTLVADARRAFLNNRDQVWLTVPSSAS
jgi:ribosomal protein S18 acetylase RimI-like enzyme